MDKAERDRLNALRDRITKRGLKVHITAEGDAPDDDDLRDVCELTAAWPALIDEVERLEAYKALLREGIRIDQQAGSRSAEWTDWQDRVVNALTEPQSDG